MGVGRGKRMRWCILATSVLWTYPKRLFFSFRRKMAESSLFAQRLHAITVSLFSRSPLWYGCSKFSTKILLLLLWELPLTHHPKMGTKKKCGSPTWSDHYFQSTEPVDIVAWFICVWFLWVQLGHREMGHESQAHAIMFLQPILLLCSLSLEQA